MAVHPAAEEQLQQLPVEVPVADHEHHDLHRFGQGLRRFVRPVGRCQRLEDIGNRHHPFCNAQVLLAQPARVTAAVHLLVVVACDVGYPLEVARERQ